MTDEVDEMSAASRGCRSFLDLPITLSSTEWNGEWSRQVERLGTVKDLLATWDIDDPDEQSEMAQVLRHLRTAVAMLNPEPSAKETIAALRKAKRGKHWWQR
jgi:hypothetical protein